MPEFALEMRQISKSYGSVRANEGITFAVKRGSIHSLAGENGAGKSTLMKILFGLVAPDSGNPESGIFLSGKKVSFKSPLEAIQSGIGMVQQHFALAPALSALDNIILGAEPSRGPFVDRNSAERILKNLAGPQLQVPWKETTEDLSVGLQQRIEILKLLFRRADILILDEPTAVLSPSEVKSFFELLRTLKSQGKTIILITHKLHEVFELCDEVTVLRQGKVIGTYETKSLTKESLVRAMIGRDAKPIKKNASRAGETLINVKDLTVSGLSRGALSRITMEVKRGEIVGIAGVEGNGQSTLVEALLALRTYSGNITFKNKTLPCETAAIREALNFGLVSEDRHSQSLWLEASVMDNFSIGFSKRLSRFGFLNKQNLKQRAESFLAPFQVKMDSVLQPISSLSGGNQQKVVMAREISGRNPEFLIACQPTRGVDVGAIEFIHQKISDLKDSGSAILLISSEIEELITLSDRILVLYEGKISGEFQGPHFDQNLIGRAMTGGSIS